VRDRLWDRADALLQHLEYRHAGVIAADRLAGRASWFPPISSISIQELGIISILPREIADTLRRIRGAVPPWIPA
jgi:hypothetical protein